MTGIVSCGRLATLVTGRCYPSIPSYDLRDSTDFALHLLILIDHSYSYYFLDGSVGKTYFVKRNSIVGSDRNCDICITSPFISRQHARIFLDENGKVRITLLKPMICSATSHHYHRLKLSTIFTSDFINILPINPLFSVSRRKHVLDESNFAERK